MELAETKKDKTASMADLRAVQTKLDARQKLITDINGEINNITGNIQQSSQEVRALENKLEGLKARYAQSVRYAYQNRNSYNMLAFLFSAESYNQAIRRLKYIKRYRDYRKQQVEEIYLTQGRLSKKIETLSTEKSKQDVLLKAEDQQRKALQQETSEKNRVVTELKGREKELLVEINKNQREAKQTDRAIQQLIARQIELERKRAQEEMRKKQEAETRRLADARRQEDARKAEAKRQAELAASRPSSGTGNSGGVLVNTGSGTKPALGEKPASTNTSGSSASSNTNNAPIAAVDPVRPSTAASSRELSMTPEAIALSNSFAANKGRLPWPVDRGVIIGKYGNYRHPIATNVILNHPGIIVQTAARANVRAVFGGTATVIFLATGPMVMIAHGEYYSVYNNLSGVSVKTGDVVSTKQTIGTVGTDSDGIPSLDFQVWKGQNKTDPEDWIAR